jgi:8-amino-7-oxononanoate synthase
MFFGGGGFPPVEPGLSAGAAGQGHRRLRLNMNDKIMNEMRSAPGAVTTIGGKRLIYFAGTGYFGLQGHPEVIRAGIKAFRKYGTHSATSRTGFGNNPVLLKVEERLGEFFEEEDAAYFGSGYLSSLILAQGLEDRYEALFVDKLAHFCIKDGVRAAGKPAYLFRHRDPEDLKKKLKARLKAGQRPLVLTDGVFPTYGQIAPVLDYARVLEPYNGLIGLDDAHGAGVLGPNGRGTAEYFGLKSSRLFLAGTLSKAFGGHGGFVIGKKRLIDQVRTRVGAYLGSTPTPTPIAAAAAKGIEILRNHPEMRKKLGQNVALVKAGLKNLGLETDETPVPIAAWSLRSAERMKKVQAALMRRGIAVAYLRYVGAPAEGVLRVTVFSTHTAEHIRRLLEELEKVL